ncbi:MAG: site-specific DNA-methyltransferase [Myxacorys californica WJT36-NPBG1]|nr:site-specific DNA-methyltransferase [Myxacorys californica WJT36-NPBG1]
MELPLNQILLGDALGVLRTLPDNSIDACVSSPPYWNLRNYGVVGQLGNEPTMGEYIQSIVAVFAEVRRILKPQGTCWVNLGDTYASASATTRRNVVGNGPIKKGTHRPNRLTDGLKEKDLCMIPHRTAIALQDGGWYVRQDLIWHKSNAMPDPTRDRCSRSHEYIFLLAKSKKYFFDQEAIKEKCLSGIRTCSNKKYDGQKGMSGKDLGRYVRRETRIKRSVWTIATKPCKEAHFATFPIDLPTLCIKAGSPEGGIILDPFMGAGTTALAALQLNRNFIGIELNPEYRQIALDRLRLAPKDRIGKVEALCC